ncbi:MAG TPA: hypothetical protein VF310_01320 [Vicinamibacteria bacterium]
MKPLRAAGLYALLTVVLTWPMATRLHIMDAGDSAFFAWEMAWEVHALTTSPARLTHAPIFHPLPHTLGYDEPIFGTTLLTLPLWIFTGDAVFVMNVTRLLTFLLSGLAAYLLARELGCSEGASLLAGAAFAFSPIRTDQIAHLSTQGTQWLPLTVLFLFRFFRTGLVRDALLAALFFTLSAYACGYHGLIGLAVLPPAALVLLWGRWDRIRAGMLAAAAAAAALVPLYLLHRAALRPLGYVRGVGETQFYSAALESFLATGPWNRLYAEVTSPFRTTHANNLFPGLVVPALAVVAAVVLWRRRERPSREAWALLALGLATVLVALGPDVTLFGRTLMTGPFGLLREMVPAFQMIRVPSRAGAFLALALVMLAAKAATTLRLRGVALVLVSALALAETLIVPIPTPAWADVVDTRLAPPPVYAWLAEQPGDPVVVELPVQDINGIFERPAYHESIYLVRQTRHWKPLANGYAGIEPAPYVDLREKARRFPSPECLAAFRERGVRYVVLHREGYGPNKWARIERELPAAAGALAEVARFGGDVVFELRAP